MGTHYIQPIQRVWRVLLWAGLMVCQTAWAQSVPDSQFARLGTTLAITTDGNIVTSNNGRVSKYALNGDKLWETGLLKGGFYIGGKVQGVDYESIARVTALGATADGGVIVAGPLNVRGGANVAVRIRADGTFDPWSEGEVFYSFVSEDIPRDLIVTSDGSPMVLSSITRTDSPSSVLIRKGSWVKEIAYPNPYPGSPDLSVTKGNSIIKTPDGGYLIVGFFDPRTTIGVGWVAKLDGDGNVSWQKLLDGLPLSMNINGPLPGSIKQMYSVTDATLAADGNGYALAGTGFAPSSRSLPPPTGAILELNADGSFKRARSNGEPPFGAFITPYTGSGGRKYYAVGNTSLQNGVDPQILLVDPAPLPLNSLDLFKVVAKRTFEAPDDAPLTGIGTAGDGSLVFVTSGNQVVKLVTETAPTPPPGGSLVLTQPTYNCQTGAIVFNTSGGNGSPITYNAPGISRSSASSNSGTVEQGLRNDPKPLTITATQSGNTVSYTFDFKAFCTGTPPPVNPPPTPPAGTPLTLLSPSYDCGSGAISFRTSGGNGSPIEYAAAGITGWTTNPNQYVDQDSRTANDVQPFTLMARQNGVTVSYVWDLKAACGRARMGVGESVAALRVVVLGNPVGEQATVEVQGAEGQRLSLRLVDLRGRLVESRLIEQAGASERQVFDLRQQGPGLLLLRVSSGTQSRIVKIVKQ